MTGKGVRMTLDVTEIRGILAEKGQKGSVMGAAPSRASRIVIVSGSVNKC
jgi:hypothetical protein